MILQYVLGLRRLGWDVLFVDRLEPGMCHDANGRACPLEQSVNFAYFRDVVARFDLGDSAALLCQGAALSIGLPRAEVLERARRSAMVLNVMGFLDDEEILGVSDLRVFLDIDPGFGQMWLELGLADVFAGHDRHLTIGERIGRPDCAIPTCGLAWDTTPQPVVLEHWPARAMPATGARVTTVATWRGPFAPIEYQGRTYGLRVHQMRRFARLPQLVTMPLELALDIDPSETRDIQLLRANGWRLVDPHVVASDPFAYRRYIAGSLGELCIAKDMYVSTRSGWFSDRSICYLAAGRPVVAQDTGFGERYPTGAGLMAFSTLEEAAAALEEIQASWPQHARAARELAETYFDSDVVLGRLLDLMGVN